MAEEEQGNELAVSLVDAVGPEAESLAKDYAELGLEQIADSDAVDKLPVIGTLISVVKVGRGVRDMLMSRKICGFLSGASVSDDERAKFLLRHADSKGGVGARIFGQGIIVGMPYPTRAQYKYKSRYRVRNWPEYEEGLRKRGSLTLWFSEQAVAAWTKPRARRKPGAQRLYANVAIETALVIRTVFHLPLRQTEGFLRSIANLMNLDIPIPDHTTLSRRARKLRALPCVAKPGWRPLHLMIDSTGLGVHNGNTSEPTKKRNWRKLHVGVDAKSGVVIAVDLTEKTAGDAASVPTLLTQTKRPLTTLLADGAYDALSVYEAADKHTDWIDTRVLIRPNKNAQTNGFINPIRERDRNIRERKAMGDRKWQKASGYTHRARVENVMYRYKSIIGPRMRSRSFAGQRIEAKIAVRILNTMIGCGVPRSEKVV